MKISIYIISCIILILLFDIFFTINKEKLQELIMFRPYKGIANCAANDIELETSKFKCKLNPINSPVNVNVKIIKYQNFGLFYNNYTPTFSANDTQLFNKISSDISKDYLKYMKVLSNIPDGQSNKKLLDINSAQLRTTISSLTDGNFSYLPTSIVNYLNTLLNLNILNKSIDVNKISSTRNITDLFELYLSGRLIDYTLLSIPYKLVREIEIIMSDDNLHIISINLNQHIIYKKNNKDVDDYSSINLNTEYKYLMIYPNDDSYLTILNKYNNILKDRNIITDYEINVLYDKTNNDKNISNILFYHKSDTDFGVNIVKRISTNVVFINYYEKPLEYSKSICMNPNDYVFKGRCYDKCLDGYTSIGLSCILNDNINQINTMFNPDSNFCKEVCASSNENVSNYDSIFQKACWCKSMSCDNCNVSNSDKCNC